MLSTQDMFDWFAKSPAGQQLVAEKEAEHIATREQLAEQLASIRAKRLKDAIAAQKREAKAADELKTAQDIAAKKLATLQQIRRDESSAAFRFDRQVQTRERQLRETSDPMIDTFLAELEAEGNELCKPNSIRSETQAKTDSRGNTKVVKVTSNLESIERRLAAIGVAREQAEALKLSPSKDIATELQRLRESLPIVQLEATGA